MADVSEERIQELQRDAGERTLRLTCTGMRGPYNFVVDSSMPGLVATHVGKTGLQLSVPVVPYNALIPQDFLRRGL